MRFLGPKFTQNALAAGALPRTLLGELRAKALPQTPCRFQGAAKGGERGRRERGIGKGKREGREGKRGGRERGRRKERDGRESLRHCR